MQLKKNIMTGFLLLGTLGCIGPVGDEVGPCSLVNLASSGRDLVLAGCPMNPEPGSAPRVFVALINGGDVPVALRARLELGTNLFVRVLRDDGSEVEPVGDTEPAEIGRRAEATLPAKGVLGRVMNLSCWESPYAEDASSSSGCRRQYDLQPGNYAVVFRYEVDCLGDPCPWWTGVLETDTLSLVVP